MIVQFVILLWRGFNHVKSSTGMSINPPVVFTLMPQRVEQYHLQSFTFLTRVNIKYKATTHTWQILSISLWQQSLIFSSQTKPQNPEKIKHTTLRMWIQVRVRLPLSWSVLMTQFPLFTFVIVSLDDAVPFVYLCHCHLDDAVPFVYLCHCHLDEAVPFVYLCHCQS
jgi:hypothetical protein